MEETKPALNYTPLRFPLVITKEGHNLPLPILLTFAFLLLAGGAVMGMVYMKTAYPSQAQADSSKYSLNNGNLAATVAVAAAIKTGDITVVPSPKAVAVQPATQEAVLGTESAQLTPAVPPAENPSPTLIPWNTPTPKLNGTESPASVDQLPH